MDRYPSQEDTRRFLKGLGWATVLSLPLWVALVWGYCSMSGRC